MKAERIPYTVGTQFTQYVAYGEHDNITDQEKRLFDELEQSSHLDAPDGYKFSHWAIQANEYDEFARCEVTNLMGACYQFDAVYFEQVTA